MEKQNLKILDKLNRIEELLIGNKTHLTVEEASQYLGLSVSYLYKLCSNGTIPFSKPNGKKLYFSRKELDTWMSMNHSSSESQIEEKALRRTL